MDLISARQMISDCGAEFADWEVASSAAAAVSAAAGLGGPVAIKSAASDVIHKSDSGCVVLGVAGGEAVEKAYAEVTTRAAAAGSTTPERVLVETMTPGLAEVIIGLKRDKTFGAVVLVGLGGIFTEVLEDFVLRLCPVTEPEALDMLRELRGFPILAGVRSKVCCDLDALTRLVVSISWLGNDRDDILELDLNPVMAMEQGALAVDARVVLNERREHGAYQA
jgi:acetyl-CoA synthetase (ADP-forming)